MHWERSIALFVLFGAMASTAPLSKRSLRRQPTTESENSLFNYDRFRAVAHNVSQTSLESWQTASTLVTHLEEVILMGQDIPPSPSCFLEERDPSTVEHPHPDTDFQSRLEADYISLLKYQGYLAQVMNDNEKLSEPILQRDDPNGPDTVYTIEFFDVVHSVSALVSQTAQLLQILDVSPAGDGEGKIPTGLASDCYETCYAQQAITFSRYSTLVFYYIPRDVSGLLDTVKG